MFVTPPFTISELPVIDVFVMVTSWLPPPCTSMPPPKPTAWLLAIVVLLMFTKGVGFVAPPSIWFVMRMLMPPPWAPTPPVPSVELFENVEPLMVALPLSPKILRPPPQYLLVLFVNCVLVMVMTPAEGDTSSMFMPPP